MKIRGGFVSNSSSCSFLAIGYIFENGEMPLEKAAELLKGSPLTEEEKKDPYEILYEGDFNFFSGGDDGLRKGETAIAEEITRWDDCEPCEISMSFEDMKKIGEKIKNKFGFDDEAILFGGTRIC